MRMHPRERLVDEAEKVIAAAVLKVLEDFDLTDAEYISVLTNALNTAILRRTKYMIRQERHGDPNKPGGLS